MTLATRHTLAAAAISSISRLLQSKAFLQRFNGHIRSNLVSEFKAIRDGLCRGVYLQRSTANRIFPLRAETERRAGHS